MCFIQLNKLQKVRCAMLYPCGLLFPRIHRLTCDAEDGQKAEHTLSYAFRDISQQVQAYMSICAMDYGPGVVEVGEDDPEEASSRATKEALFVGVLLTILSALRCPCFFHTLASPGSRDSGRGQSP